MIKGLKRQFKSLQNFKDHEKKRAKFQLYLQKKLDEPESGFGGRAPGGLMTASDMFR